MTGTDEPTAKGSGPRHAAPRVSVGSRLRGRALAMAAVPTALLLGATYTPSLAMADTQTGGKTCAASPDTVLSETPVPKSDLKVLPTPGTGTGSLAGTVTGTLSGTAKTVTKSAAQAPAPTPSAGPAKAPAPAVAAPKAAAQPTPAAQPVQPAQTPSAQPKDIIGDILNGIFHPGGGSTPTPTPTPPSTQAPAPTPSGPSAPTPAPSAKPSAAPSAPADRAAGTASPSSAATTPAATPSPSASTPANPNCNVSAHNIAAKSAGSGDVVPEQNWVLHSSRLALHGSVFNGVYDVRTPTGTKRVLKFTTASVDIGDLDMSTIEVTGKTFHVKGAPGSTSTMRSGPITMYVESLSGHLSAIYGLPIPIDLGQITLTPDTLPQWLYDLIGAVPIPLDITLDQAKAVQAGQFGGTLHIPGMHMYNDETPYDG